MSPSPTSGLQVRKATLDDAGTLAALLAEMDDEPLDIDVPIDGAPHPASGFDSATMREVLLDMAAYPNFCAYLLLDDSTPIGRFSLMIFSGPSHRGAMQALLDAVVVTHSRRGSGIGEVMIRHALNFATAAGCYKMSLSSNLKRLHAHRFYERLGFRQHGISFSIDLENGRALSNDN